MNYAQLVRDNVVKYGFHATYVADTEGEETGPSFTYSTGIYETYGIPEIIISSLPPNLSHELITQYIHRFQASGPLIDQRINKKNERFDYYLVRVPLERIHGIDRSIRRSARADGSRNEKRSSQEEECAGRETNASSGASAAPPKRRVRASAPRARRRSR